MDIFNTVHLVAVYTVYFAVSYVRTPKIYLPGFEPSLISLLLKVSLLLAYRLTLHPLRNYPGPFLAKILDAYGGYYAARRRVHLTTYQNHVRYGTVAYLRNRLR